MSLRYGYSAIETRAFKATGRDITRVERDEIEIAYSEIAYCRPTPGEEVCEPTTYQTPFSHHWLDGKRDARWFW